MKLSRTSVIYLVVAALFVVIIARLFFLQVLDPQYKEFASNNVLRYETLYPPRGEVFDRNGEYLVRSKEVYDLTVIPREIPKEGFDTLLICSIIGETPERFGAALQKAKNHSMRQASVLYKQLPKETKLKLEERGFQGFHTVLRTLRSYPRDIGGNLLGYVGEVNQGDLDRDRYYRAGDYIGKTGVELAYEDILRGRKGVRVNMVDVRGVVQGSYMDGLHDTLPVPGTAITSTIDLQLQALGEELMRGKVGSIVAIEPATGEILVMVSSPTYNPEYMVGREVNTHFPELRDNVRKPFTNRAVASVYPPGSTFKIVNGMIGLQEGVLTPETRYSCNNGYMVQGRTLKCHAHWSPLPLVDAVQTSCNAYFCYVLRNVLDNRKYGGVKKGFEEWERYVRSFGFGRTLGSDFIDERGGRVPSVETYDKMYRGRWNSLTVLSLSIGQGEIGASPLQMANMAATVANRGHYYIPHIVKRIHDRDSLDERFYIPHRTLVDAKHFEPIVEGMWRAVNREGGTGYHYRIEGLDMCGKTGTAQNPHGADHSTFLCFAPRDNPRIAVSVYVENGGFGATIAAPIASLIVEQYLTGKIERQHLIDYVKNKQIAYPYYDRQQRRP